MSVNLSKGGKVSLVKEAKSLGIDKLDLVHVGLGWDVNDNGSTNFDLDAWAIPTDSKTLNQQDLVFFGNLRHRSRSIWHSGDNLTGDGDGDDEVININLSKLPAHIDKIIIGVTIFKAKRRFQKFKDVHNTFIRVFTDASYGEQEICRYADEFSNSLGNYHSIVFGAFVKENNEWRFIALGNGLNADRITECLDELSKDLVNFNNRKEKKNMAVNLSKGGKVSLAKAAADSGVTKLNRVGIGLGWDCNKYSGGGDFDLDASAFLTGAGAKVRSDADFIFYNNKDANGIHHTGDNRTGDGDGDDELIEITLNDVDADVEKVSFTVTIHDADTRRQNFGMVENAYIRIFDLETGTEMVRYDLTEDFSVETAIVVGELYRHNGEWKFNAVGSGFSGGLYALCQNFGVNV